MTVRRIRTRVQSQPAAAPTSIAGRRKRTVEGEEAPAPKPRVRRTSPPAEEKGVAPRVRRAAPAQSLPLIAALNASNQVLTGVLMKGGTEIQRQRPGHYLHVSDLLSKCIRRRALGTRFSLLQKPRRLTLSDLLTFSQGDAIHDTLKARARIGRPEYVWGKWSCKCEYLKHDEPCTYSEIDQSEECPHCHSKVDHYHEVSIFDEEYWIVGNPDLLLYLPSLDAIHVTELKSISHEQYKELNRPKPEHVLQVVFYWFLARRAGWKLTDKVSILYATKTWQFSASNAIREFIIDPQEELHRLDDMLADAAAYKAAHEDVKADLPARTFCSSKGAKAAKDCEACDICFEVT